MDNTNVIQKWKKTTIIILISVMVYGLTKTKIGSEKIEYRTEVLR